MNKVKDKLPALVEEELAAAMTDHPFFSSAHEGYAVLLEEVEEAESDMRAVRNKLSSLWYGVKSDNSRVVSFQASLVKGAAIHLAAEAIQVAAMAQKLMASIEAVTP